MNSICLSQSFFQALAYDHLLHGNKERSKQFQEAAEALTRKPDTRPECGEELGRALAEAGSAHAYVNDDEFRWTLTGELLAVPHHILAGVACASKIVLRIDSPGGSSRAAETLLTALEGKTVRVEARTALSAAALIVACAPGHRTITSDGRMMLHRGGTCAMGDAGHLRAVADWLEKFEGAWIDRLTARTCHSRATVESWLTGDDVHFTPAQALAFGLVDEISPSGLVRADAGSLAPASAT